MELFLGTPLKILHAQLVVSPCQRANKCNPQSWWVTGPENEQCPPSWNSSATEICPTSSSALALWLSSTLESWSADSQWVAVRVDVATASPFPNSQSPYSAHSGCKSRSCDHTALWITSPGLGHMVASPNNNSACRREPKAKRFLEDILE